MMTETQMDLPDATNFVMVMLSAGSAQEVQRPLHQFVNQSVEILES